MRVVKEPTILKIKVYGCKRQGTTPKGPTKGLDDDLEVVQKSFKRDSLHTKSHPQSMGGPTPRRCG